MTLRADSYGSTSEVKANTRHLLDGQSTFNTTTRPTLTELEKFIDRASGILNVALRGVGLSVPITNSTAKLSCDDWVVNHATAHVEMTQRGAGFSEDQNTRAGSFMALNESAQEFAAMMAIGFRRLGVTVSDKVSDGLQFTGLDARDQRSDPDDSTLRQPRFERGKFDDRQTSEFMSDGSEDY